MNKVEAWKAAKHGFDVWGDLVRHAEAGTPMAEIDEPDLERMKWYGVFYRKRVEDGRYMIRVRIPGCELTSGQARAVGAIARAAYSIVDVTTRGNVQVQGLTGSQLVQALGTLEATGLTAKQTGHDNVRNVMCHPWAGLDPDDRLGGRVFGGEDLQVERAVEERARRAGSVQAVLLGLIGESGRQGVDVGHEDGVEPLLRGLAGIRRGVRVVGDGSRLDRFGRPTAFSFVSDPNIYGGPYFVTTSTSPSLRCSITFSSSGRFTDFPVFFS